VLENTGLGKWSKYAAAPKGAVPECGQLGSGGMWAFACAVGSDADAAKWLKPRYYSGHFLRSRRLARSMHKDLRTPVITGNLAHNVAEVMKSPRLESLLANVGLQTTRG